MQKRKRNSKRKTNICIEVLYYVHICSVVLAEQEIIYYLNANVWYVLLRENFKHVAPEIPNLHEFNHKDSKKEHLHVAINSKKCIVKKYYNYNKKHNKRCERGEKNILLVSLFWNMSITSAEIIETWVQSNIHGPCMAKALLLWTKKKDNQKI